MKRWAEFIRYVEQHYPESEERLVLTEPAERVQAAFRRSEDQAYTLRSGVGAVSDLVKMTERDLVRGTILVPTREVGFVGDRVALWIVHPHSEQIFELAAKIGRVVNDGGLRGAELEVLDLDPARLKRFDEPEFD